VSRRTAAGGPQTSKIAILDFGSQYTQVIARRVRECRVYSEILPHDTTAAQLRASGVQGIIFSGGPASVYAKGAPRVDRDIYRLGLPILGICYGMQLLARDLGGAVEPSKRREFGPGKLSVARAGRLFAGLPRKLEVWNSHGDKVTKLPRGFVAIGTTENSQAAAVADLKRGFYGLQFHPEVSHTPRGSEVIENFLLGVCGCRPDWTPGAFIEQACAQIREQVGEDRVVLGLSGGVDSSVAAALLHKAIGKQLTCIFVDNGLLRKDEFSSVLENYTHMGLNVRGVDAGPRFLAALAGLTDPEAKRKAIGRVFIEVFDAASHEVEGARWLGQGTIYPDVIESVSATGGPSATIKSHHNVGGLPDFMQLQVVEPLRLLFKDEVRRVGRALGIREDLLGRHPFPGPGLGIRILGEVTAEKVRVLQEVDALWINGLRKEGLYDEVWQAGAILLPVQSVGVMGDERTYENAVALRAVTSTDGMTADFCHLPHEFLGRVSNEIINKVRGVNRVVYDISSKPPATIEWE